MKIFVCTSFLVCNIDHPIRSYLTTTTSGHVHALVWRPTDGNWYVKGIGRESWAGSKQHVTQWGAPGY